MKKNLFILSLLISTIGLSGYHFTPVKKDELKVYIIRHGEKPSNGDNLSCQGLNRALQLPPVLYAKCGAPDYTYIPSVSDGKSTSHSRMFQTVTPFAVKYNLTLNSKYDVNDATGVAADILKKKTGTVLIVWEHTVIPGIAKALGVTNPGGWSSTFDSIWVITIHKDKVTMTKDIEGLKPSASCQ